MALSLPGLGAEPAAPAAESEPVVPKGTFHTARLNLPIPDGNSISLHLVLRDGKIKGYHAVDNERLVDGRVVPRIYSAILTEKAHELWDCSGLRLDGGVLKGRIVATKAFAPRTPVKPFEFIIDATVKDGTLAGTVNGSPLTGHWRSDQEMARAETFAAGVDWPQWSGPLGVNAGRDSGVRLVDDLRQARLVWISEEDDLDGARYGDSCKRFPYPYGRGQARLGGISSPIVADGRIYFNSFVGHGEVRDKGPVAYDAQLMNVQVDGSDVVLCVDLASGKTLWKNTFTGKGINPDYAKHACINNTGCSTRSSTAWPR